MCDARYTCEEIQKLNRIEFSLVGTDQIRQSGASILRKSGIKSPTSADRLPASPLEAPPQLTLCDNLSEMFIKLIELPARPDAINPRQFVQYFLFKQAHYPYINFLALMELGREVLQQVIS